MQVRPLIALGLTGLVTLAAACTVTIPAVADKKAAKKPSAVPSALVGDASAVPSDAPSTAPSASASKAAGPFDEAGLPGAPPPFGFPYSKVATGWNFALHVKAGAFPVDGTATITVKAVTQTDATVQTVLKISAAFLGGGDKPNVSLAHIRKDVQNPFSLGALMTPPAGGKVGTAASKLPDIQTTSTIVKWAHEHMHTDAGDFDCNKYLLNEVAGPETTRVVLWIDQATGQLVKEQIDSDKLPDLGSSLQIPAGISLGKTTTTLTLKGPATPDQIALDGSATAPAVVDHPATSTAPASGAATVDPNASAAATPDPTASARAAMALCPGGAPALAPVVGTRGQGAYQGVLLPNGFDTRYTSEGAVTAALVALANASAQASAQPAASGAASPSPSASPAPDPDWTTFKCLYPAALKIWRSKTDRTD